MDARLFEAAQGGNIEYLQQLLTENPFILNIALLSDENPLNIAADMGHVDFVKEIIRLKPVFAREVNQEGFSPMHIAAANGHVELVKELMKVDIKLCRGRAEVVSAMLLDCPDCIEDETDQRENALHLVVKNNRFEAIKILMGWIRETNKEYLLNMKDEQRNTVESFEFILLAERLAPTLSILPPSILGLRFLGIGSYNTSSRERGVLVPSYK
ncbi:unnamed protein product [Dovyalis caffra]|uniref:Ankyrin repeat-containing protein BDA1-like n=1 Tax=Dovyalis caffra TaxID=77055 RepID=A0AAV1RJM9_9ROSI|nr:unnamed protein product [Dovyalis caffra]